MKREYFLFLIIAIGLVLRLVWTSDMEWKEDEQWMYAQAHEIASSHSLPAAGMRSGGGIVNPGFSVVIFAFAAALTDSPVAMGRMVQLVNVASILCFLVFIFVRVKPEERQTWLLGITLASVSPLAVLFSRKIWAQDMLPLFSFLVLLGNTNRTKHWGAFIWGIAGALIGQIHMSGFFFAAGIFVFTVLSDRYNKLAMRWVPFILGSLVGGISIFPWLDYMWRHPQASHLSLMHLLEFNFYICWFLDSEGLNTMYSLRKEFWEFIKYPFIGSVPTYLIAIAHLILVGGSVITLIQLKHYLKRMIGSMKEKKIMEYLFKNNSLLKFYLWCILLGLGVFMTFCGTTTYTHYLICAFPFSYIFLARILKDRQRLLMGLILVQLFVTMTFLGYIHAHGGAAGGDYGITYQKQTEKEK